MGKEYARLTPGKSGAVSFTNTSFVCVSYLILNTAYVHTVFMHTRILHTCVLSHSGCVQLFATLWTVARQAPLSMILQARIWEWVAMPSSRGSYQPRDGNYVSYVSCTGSREGNGTPLQYSCLENPMDGGA